MVSHQYRDPHDKDKTEGLAQERRNSIANALELRLSCTKSSKWSQDRFLFIMQIPIPGNTDFLMVQGWGLLSKFSLLRYFPNFSE